MSSTSTQPLQLVILSGGTGRTAEQVVAAALAQFENAPVEIITKNNIRRTRDAVQVVREAARRHAIVCQTMVAPRIREAVNEELLRLNVPSVDILGPVISLLADHLQSAPRGRPGLLYELCKEQFDRSDAVDFTLAHDDGLRVHDLKRADVVLVGVSRVSKSVTCFYLAARGVRAANFPLTSAMQIPPQLEKMPRNRVIGLTMNAPRLCAIRETRLSHISHRHVDGYTDPREVAAEVRAARELIDDHGWRRIDVSYKATEEVASEILEMLPARKN